MPSRTYYLGKNGTFTFSAGIANADVKSVTVNRETAAEVDVTTRGSGNEQEFAFVRKNTTIDVVVLNHSIADIGVTGTIVCQLSPTGPFASPTGVFQVMSVSEPQELDGAVEWTVNLRKTPT